MNHEVFRLGEPEAEQFLVPLAAGRLGAAKRSFATRRIDLDQAAGLVVADAAPRAGDLMLARIDGIGQHKRLEEPGGRRATLYPGDEVLVVYGDRYAPDQFEAHVPDDLGPCDLVAGGGIAARVLRKSGKVRGATRLVPVGLVTDAAGRRLNTRDFAIGELPPAPTRPQVIAVVGSSMNAGKTTTMAALARGEHLAGRRVGAVKATGTGSGGDLWAYRDAGAELVLDFTDAGFATTHRIGNDEREHVLDRLVARAAAEGVETLLVEIADGLLLPETEALVLSATFRRLADGVVFAAPDAMSALAGAVWLERHGLPVLAISGAVTASPASMDEIARHTGHPVLGISDMTGGGGIAGELLLSECAA